MKICVAQTKPIKGNIPANIEAHKGLTELAIANNADMIFFPELSITGYEPELAKELATDINDNRLDIFQNLSDFGNISIGVGMPLKNDGGITISMIIFQPRQPREVYSKKYLHKDEFPFFISGQNKAVLKKNNISLAICYEISIPEHSENACKEEAKIYIASVAKTPDGVEKAVNTLSAIAKKYSMTVFMSNCTGHCDNFDCGGKTSAWDSNGVLAGQLDDTGEGILIFETDSKEVIKRMI